MFSIKKIIITIILVVLAFVGYSMLISNKEKTSASGVTKQTVGDATPGQNVSTTLDGPGKEFVTQLLAIQSIKFNLELFSDPVFKGLQDWSREIQPQESGRPNPFAPLEGEGINISNVNSGFARDIQSNSSLATSTNPRSSTEIKSPIVPAPRANQSTR